MKQFYLKISLSFLLLLSATSNSVADVNAYLNQTSFFEGDPITLNLESTTNNNAKPDLAPLNIDFIILGTGTSFQETIMNGQRNFKRIWTVELQTKNTVVNEKLTIPAIKIGNETTQAVGFTVTKLPAEVTAETKEHIFIETAIGTHKGSTFVQQQIPYTLKLFYDASMQTAEIQAPVIENAIIEKLGADKRYKVTRAGKRLNVVERHYVISPEKSGPLRIPPVIVKGRIALSGGDSPTLRKRMDETDMLNNFFNDSFLNDSFGSFFSNRSRGLSKPFSLMSEEINVDVLPVPPAFTGSTWLPAEDIVIGDSWAKKPPSLQVGEPVTRILTLQAKGLAGSQIPEITYPKPKKLKSYPDKPKSETRTDGTTVFGLQQTEITYIPDASGKVIVPKISIDWWDVQKSEQRTFELPEWNLNVAPDPNSFAEEEINLPSIAEQPTANLTPETNEPVVVTENTKSSETNPDNSSSLKIISAILFFIMLIAAFIYRKKMKSKNLTEDQQPLSAINKRAMINKLRTSLLNACQSNNKNLAASELIAYAQAEWCNNSIQNLGSLASNLTEGSEVIKELEQSLYSQDAHKWDGKALASLIENGLSQKQNIQKKSSDELAPLYPA